MRFPWSSKPRRVRHKPIVRAPFLGRESILAELHGHLQAARDGSTQYVALRGPYGIGKSALLTEFALMQRVTPDVLLVRLHASDALLTREFYVHLFAALRTQSENVLTTLFNETKRLRKVLSVQWDETEFHQVLISADWVQLQEESRHEALRMGGRSDPLRQLLTSVRRHPWAVGAATILDTMTRAGARTAIQDAGVYRWAALLHGIQARRLPDGAVLVLVIDQLTPDVLEDAEAMERWVHHWRAFVEITREHMLPLLIVWAGTEDSLLPVRQAVSDAVPLTVHAVEGLEEDAYQQLTMQLRRSLPGSLKASWQRLAMDHAERFRGPGSLILAATWLAARAETQPLEEDAVLSVVQAEDARLVDDLVEIVEQRHPEAQALARQFLEACAFLESGKEFTVEDVLSLCDLDALGGDIMDGRAKLEILLRDWVRYGLLTYGSYPERYTTNHHVIQDVLKRLARPEAYECHTVARRRRLASAIIHHVQSGDGDMLGELGRIIETPDGEDGVEQMASYIVSPLRRILARSPKDERQRMARALGRFRSPLAVDLLMTLLSDKEDAVRSMAAQSLADLDGLETCSALLKACQDRNSDVRWIAASALGKIEGKPTVDTLIDMLIDEDKEVCRVAAQALGSKGDVRAVPHLIAAVRENYPLLRESAALALGQLADRRALPALQDLLQDANRQVRRSAEHALAQIAASSC